MTGIDLFHRDFSRLILLTLFLLFIASATAQESQTADFHNAIRFLTGGVDTLPVCGVPGPVVPFGDNSFPVILGNFENSTYAPVASASFVGEGRVFAFGHTGYCSADSIGATESSKRLFSNTLLWAAGKEDESPDKLRVAVWADERTTDFLKNEGFNAFTLTKLNQNFDVLVAGAVALDDAQYDALFKKVRSGAGFVTSGLGWGWSQINPEKNLVFEHNGNKNFIKNGVGIAWTSGTLSATKNKEFIVDSRIIFDNKYSNGTNALDFVAKASNKSGIELESPTDEELRQISATLILILPYLSPEQLSKVDNLIENSSREVAPSEKQPVRDVDPLERLIISLQIERYLHGQASGLTDVKDIPALPAANVFPGAVPDSAPRLSNVPVKIQSSIPDWTSTGLYAAPGEVISIETPFELPKATTKLFKVRIGVHSDNLKYLPKWSRYPEITIEKPLKESVTQIVNPFGGNIYIVVPRGLEDVGLGLIEFKITGAVAAPYFIRGTTSLDEWKTLRENPAPWAELQGRNVILTVPSKDIRKLDNPLQLIKTWDQILDLEAEFASGPYLRERPERITCDIQISAGYMHSGYPVMTHMDVEEDLVNEERLRRDGDWGFYHEFGHNHQSPYWTFDGAGEVTVNYFTLYVMEKLNGKSPERAKYELSDEARRRIINDYFENGSKFEEWKANPFLALLMTVEMRDKFGWEPFIRSISEYKKASPSELPKNDQEKRDQWMQRLSRNSGLNLGLFFTMWGIHVSKEALESVSELPTWIPTELEKYSRNKISPSK